VRVGAPRLAVLTLALAVNGIGLQPLPAGATSPAVTVTYSNSWQEPLALHVFGRVHNDTSDDVSLVRVGLNLLDGTGATLESDLAWSSLNVLAPQENAPFEAIIAPVPIGYSAFAITGVSFTRSSTSPYHADLPVTLTACHSGLANDVCGTVTNTGQDATTVENVHVAVTLYDSNGTMVAQNQSLLDPTASNALAPGDSGTFSISRTGEPTYAAVLAVAEPSYPVDLNPVNLDFGNQFLKTTSLAKTITVRNNGTRDLAIQNISAPPDFTPTSHCPLSLAPATSCSVTVTFQPSVIGPQTGELTITDDGAGSPDTVTLSGTGIAPIVNLVAAGGTSFGSIDVGTSSPPKKVTLTNVGNAPLVVTGASVSGDFAAVDLSPCLVTLAVNAHCQVSLIFTPTAPGNRTGGLTLVDNAPDTPQVLHLSGIGLGPAATLAPQTLNFGDQAVGAVQLPVTLTSTGTTPLQVQFAFTTNPAFSLSACVPSIGPALQTPFQLAPAASCTITVSFSGSGRATGQLIISDDAGFQTVSMVGNPTAARTLIQTPPNSGRSGEPPPPFP
jgi:Transmembrane protein 131-like N-terminal